MIIIAAVNAFTVGTVEKISVKCKGRSIFLYLSANIQEPISQQIMVKSPFVHPRVLLSKPEVVNHIVIRSDLTLNGLIRLKIAR